MGGRKARVAAAMEPVTPFWQSRLHALAALAVGVSALGLAGCSPKVGDHCVLNTDCGSSGTLVCDTSLPNGYCTQFNCTANACQDSAACVVFEPAVPGCPYDDYRSPARTARTFCLAACNSDSDCRQSDGYVCDDPRGPPWNAAILDDNQGQHVCVPAFSPSAVAPGYGDSGLPEGSVCSSSGPQLDASFGQSAPDATAEAMVDAPGDAVTHPDAEAGSEAGQADAAEAGPTDAAIDGGGGALDAPPSDAADAGLSDAPDEG